MGCSSSSPSKKEEVIPWMVELWGKCSKNTYVPGIDDHPNRDINNIPIPMGFSNIVELFHATTEENRKAIVASGEFRVPSKKYAIQNGLKLGAAVYFGSNSLYCMYEARNTASNKGKEAALLKVKMDLGRCIDLGDYEAGNNLKWSDWEWMTSRLTIKEANEFGFDSICINKNQNSFTIALYEPKKFIISLQPVDHGFDHSVNY